MREADSELAAAAAGGTLAQRQTLQRKERARQQRRAAQRARHLAVKRLLNPATAVKVIPSVTFIVYF